MTLALSTLTQRPEEERFLGKFQLLEMLGSGGFAPVWLAREMLGDTELRKVAIKLFSIGAEEAASANTGSGSRRKEALTRVIEEVHALCRVEHPNIVRFSGIVADDELGVVGLVMELLSGTTLDRDLEDGHSFDGSTIVDLGQQLAWALTAIHRAGLVHRDIKPGNVMHDGNTYRLIDLGIASRQPDEHPGHEHPGHEHPGHERQGDQRQEDADQNEPTASFEMPDLPAAARGTKATTHFSYIRELSSDRTAAGLGPAASTSAIASGTIGYMDPRSFTCPPTVQGDLYSLGATLYECLTGFVPAAAANRKLGRVDEGLRGAVLDGREAPPSVGDGALRPDLPHALIELIDSLIQPDPGERPASAEAVACIFERIRAEQSTQHRHLPPEGPFRGLARFESSDRTVLFGRSTELAASLEVLRARGMLALVGPSGSGKSSLARAGVTPAIEEGRLGSWPKRFETITVEPGNHPRERLSKALDRFVPDALTLASGVLLTRLQRWTRQHDTGIILLLDQFEELVTLDVSPDEQQWTARLLEALGNAPNAGLCTIVGARRDQLDRLLSLPELARVLPRCMLLVTPMTRETWGEVLDQALHAYGYRLEDAHLKAEVLAGIGDTPMPLVQFALTRLWEGRDRKHQVIPRSALKTVGGIAGALNAHAESIREQLRQREPQVDDVLRRLLLDLTTPEGTRRSRNAEELARLAPPEQGRHLLRALMENRLLERDGDRYIFPHEALIDQWTSLSNWVKEARADRRVLTDLERDAEIWKNREDESLLWRGARLLEATQLATSGQHHISDAGTQFIETAAGRERHARLLKRAWLAAGVAAILIGTILYAVFQQQQRAFADARRKEAVAARDEATRAKQEAENAKTLAEEQRNRAKQAEDKAATDAQKYAADLSSLRINIDQAKTVAKLLQIQTEIREKLGTVETKPVTAVNATPIDRQFGAPP